MAEATLSSQNQIVIPREAREALQLKPGDKLIVRTHGRKILILEKPESHSRAIRGLMRRGYGKGYLRKERDSWE
jgi:AbrB family looped-hinge helix DNA binding protein